MPETFITKDEEDTRGRGDTIHLQRCVNPLTELVLCEEFLKGPSLREIAIMIWLVSGTSGFHIEPDRNNEHLLGILPGCTECLRPLMRIFDYIDHIA